MSFKHFTLGRNQRIALLITALPLAFAAVFMMRIYTPAQLHLPACGFHELTGFYCPGCGATRAIYHLARGEWVLALRSNIFILCGLPFLGFIYIQNLVNAIKPGTIPIIHLSANGSRMIAVIVLLWWLVRNLPFGVFHIPA